MRVTLIVGIAATISVALCAAKSIPSESGESFSHIRNSDGVDLSYESKRYPDGQFSKGFDLRGNGPHRPRKDTEKNDNGPLRSQKSYDRDEDNRYHSHDDDFQHTPHKIEKERKEEKKSTRKNHKEASLSSRKRVDSRDDAVDEDSKPNNGDDDSVSIDDEEVDPATKELFAIARQQAIQVIVEKMLIAFGPDFMPQPLPNNDTMPTVSSPLNITTEPCPEIYAQCSSQNIFSACKPPRHSHKGLWKQRFNLYFDLPSNLLEHDELLGATLRIYKHSPLPLKLPTPLIVEIYSYTKSLTLKRDWNMLINSTKVSSDFVGWVSLDLTDLIRNLEPKKNHGFLIKVRDINGIHWNAPEHFVPMNCSDINRSLVPVPFGVMTEEPEHKFPSLTIHTGKRDHYYTELDEEDKTHNYDDDSFAETRKEEDVPPQYEEDDQITDYLGNDDREMPGDDPSVHRNNPIRFDDDDNESHIVRHGRKNLHHQHPHSPKFHKSHDKQQTMEKVEEIEERKSSLSSSISSLEEELVSSTKIWKKNIKNALPAIYETQVTITRRRPQPPRKKQHQSDHEWDSISHRSHPNSEEEERHHETRHRHPRQRRSYKPHLQVMS